MIPLSMSVCAWHGEVVTKTGAWRIPPSFRYHLDEGLAEGIANFVKTNGERGDTLTDIGAGKGLYVRYWNGHGLKARGVEGIQNIEKLTGGIVRYADLSTPSNCTETTAWATCLEVLEHIPHRFEEAALQNVNCTARRGLIVSWSPPGQIGSGHVNLRTKDWIINRF